MCHYFNITNKRNYIIYVLERQFQPLGGTESRFSNGRVFAKLGSLTFKHFYLLFSRRQKALWYHKFTAYFNLNNAERYNCDICDIESSFRGTYGTENRFTKL
jgi:hypothetical protein